jgi:diaminopimelate epimerase
MRFEKYEGLGNDFLVVDARDEDEVGPARAVALCDRRLGVGGDGVLLVLPPRTPGAAARMRVVNADGSVPEMCGNGIRCVAIHLARKQGQAAAELRIDTDAGPRVCQVEDVAGAGMVTVEMGEVRVLGERTVEVEGMPESLTVADVGNPHAVLFGSFTRDEVARIGPRIATHPAFPRGTNVEFARAAGGQIDLVVWERGVGITLACGTGACATAAVACAKGLATKGAPIEVRLPGGPLQVTIQPNGFATMRGPARRVYAGELKDE